VRAQASGCGRSRESGAVREEPDGRGRARERSAVCACVTRACRARFGARATRRPIHCAPWSERARADAATARAWS
jgi:hypothetical protein